MNAEPESSKECLRDPASSIRFRKKRSRRLEDFPKRDAGDVSHLSGCVFARHRIGQINTGAGSTSGSVRICLPTVVSSRENPESADFYRAIVSEDDLSKTSGKTYQVEMMKVYVQLLAVVLLAALVAEAAVFREPNAKSETQPNKCKSSVFNLHLKINKTYRMPNTCGEMICDKSYTINYATCGTVSVEPPLKLVQNMKLRYPDCCPTPVLDSEAEE